MCDICMCLPHIFGNLLVPVSDKGLNHHGVMFQKSRALLSPWYIIAILDVTSLLCLIIKTDVNIEDSYLQQLPTPTLCA